LKLRRKNRKGGRKVLMRGATESERERRESAALGRGLG
jgi:hypothetical protein